VVRQGDQLQKSEQAVVMPTNIGNIDRTVRVVIGLMLIAYAIPLGFPNTGWNWVGWIGVIPIVTAFVGTCPAYSVLGVSTCAVSTRKS
jgi:hypothetical protein